MWYLSIAHLCKGPSDHHQNRTHTITWVLFSCPLLWFGLVILTNKLNPPNTHFSFAVMYWLHKNLNSDFSTIWHFSALLWWNFGQFFCSYLADVLPKKYWEHWHWTIIRQIICTWQPFNIFWQSFGTFLERKKYLADFGNLVFLFLLNFGTNFGGKLKNNKTSSKSADEKSRYRTLDLRVANYRPIDI